jgi:hypothetical protein
LGAQTARSEPTGAAKRLSTSPFQFERSAP